MGKAHRHPQLVAGLGRQFHADPLAEGGQSWRISTATSKIAPARNAPACPAPSGVWKCSPRIVPTFALSDWFSCEMHPPGGLGKAVLPEDFREIAALVAQPGGHDLYRALNGE
jgi:hypothetical protein